MLGIALQFPEFNLYSSPLLILALQGLVFTALLFGRYASKRNSSDAILAFILLISCYHQTSYTIGFMGWYDTFRETKINYYLIDLSLVLGPLFYFYVRSITVSNFRFKAKNVLHFVPWLVFLVVKIFILVYDASQPGFAETQNGYLVQNFQWKYLEPFYTVFFFAQLLLYLSFTLQLFFTYRKNIMQFFSNTYRLELDWIRNFLLVYTALFLYDVGQTIVTVSITELHWTQKWWLHFFSAIAILYVGMKGYFTNTASLKGLHFDGAKSIVPEVARHNDTVLLASKDALVEKVNLVRDFFNTETPYLDPELNLVTLSERLKWNRAELSEVINSGFQMNFNDFVNSYRVEAVKKMFADGKQSQLSILGLAFECGFNSKATFNRVFKKFTQQSPTQYLNAQK